MKGLQSPLKYVTEKMIDALWRCRRYPVLKTASTNIADNLSDQSHTQSSPDFELQRENTQIAHLPGLNSSGLSIVAENLRNAHQGSMHLFGSTGR